MHTVLYAQARKETRCSRDPNHRCSFHSDVNRDTRDIPMFRFAKLETGSNVRGLKSIYGHRKTWDRSKDDETTHGEKWGKYYLLKSPGGCKLNAYVARNIGSLPLCNFTQLCQVARNTSTRYLIVRIIKQQSESMIALRNSIKAVDKSATSDTRADREQRTKPVFFPGRGNEPRQLVAL